MSDGQRTENVFGVLATTLVLGVFALAILVIVGLALFGRAQTLDGDELAKELFRDGVPPFGLVAADATRFPSRERIARYALPASSETPRSEPDEVVCVIVPSLEAAEKLFEAAGAEEGGFGPPREEGDDAREASQRLIDWQADPSFAWSTLLKADEVVWSRWEARYRIVRAFRADGTWRDSVRVELSQPQRPLILFAQLPPGVEATDAHVDAVVRTVKML